MWARFMKQATRNDKPDWLDRPSNITSVRICRLSGKLATDACRNAADESDKGTRQAMAYYENFVTGTEPTETCPIHNRVIGNPLRALAALFSPKASMTPSPAVAHAPAAVTAAESTSETPKANPAPAPKKRGFWSRVFGGGKNEKNQKDEKGTR
jgi:hypothetical protein